MDISNYLEDKSRTRNHFKSRLHYHIIFSTKYRKKLLEEIKEDVFEAFERTQNDKFSILKMNTDRDHIHLVISTHPDIPISYCIHRMKQYTTYFLYKNDYDYLRRFYWGKKKHIWTHGYFVSTIGAVSEEKVMDYVEKQGQ